MKSNNLILAFIVVVLSISASCNLEKRVEKQQKAFDNIGRSWLKLHPCANDSFTIYIPGRRDSIPIEIPVIILDTTYTKKQLDSLQKSLRERFFSPSLDCSTEIKEAYNLGYNSAAQKYIHAAAQIKIPLPVIDTLKITLKDKQAIKILEDQLAVTQSDISSLTLEKERAMFKKDKWFLLFLLICILLIFGIYVNIKK